MTESLAAMATMYSMEAMATMYSMEVMAELCAEVGDGMKG
jgi:hypothetical protein